MKDFIISGRADPTGGYLIYEGAAEDANLLGWLDAENGDEVHFQLRTMLGDVFGKEEEEDFLANSKPAGDVGDACEACQ